MKRCRRVRGSVAMLLDIVAIVLLILLIPTEWSDRLWVALAYGVLALIVTVGLPRLEVFRRFELRSLIDSDGYRRLKAIDILIAMGDVCRDHATTAVVRLGPGETAGLNEAQVAMRALPGLKKKWHEPVIERREE